MRIGKIEVPAHTIDNEDPVFSQLLGELDCLMEAEYDEEISSYIITAECAHFDFVPAHKPTPTYYVLVHRDVHGECTFEFQRRESKGQVLH